MFTFYSTLLSKKQLTTNIFLFKFSISNEQNFSYLAGQYIIFHIPQSEGNDVRRLYSIASSPYQKNILEFIIELIPEGIGSDFLTQLNVGDKIKLQGPAGLFTINQSYRDNIFLATGTGIAPIRSMILKSLTDNKKNW